MGRELTLPAIVVGPADLARLCRNLETYHEAVQQAELRQKSTPNASVDPLPGPGRLLLSFAKTNEFDLQDARQRSDLIEQLSATLKVAPVVTMSFAADPSAAFMSKVVDWFRQTTHPQLLIRIGLQPNIAAGFTLRTPAKLYDFSLRNKFAEQRPMLIQRLRQSVNTQQPREIQAPSVESTETAE